jgi:hypothetical protein
MAVPTNQSFDGRDSSSGPVRQFTHCRAFRDYSDEIQVLSLFDFDFQRFSEFSVCTGQTPRNLTPSFSPPATRHGAQRHIPGCCIKDFSSNAKYDTKYRYPRSTWFVARLNGRVTSPVDHLIRVFIVKVLYTINQATHYCLARHMPVAVKIVTPSKQTGKANRGPKHDSRDSKQAPSNSHVTRNQSAASGTGGSSTNIDWANIDPALRELDASQPLSEEEEEEHGQLYGHVALKSCANAIWAAR